MTATLAPCRQPVVKYTMVIPVAGLGGIDLGGGVTLAPQAHRYFHLCAKHAAEYEAKYGLDALNPLESWATPANGYNLTCRGDNWQEQLSW